MTLTRTHQTAGAEAAGARRRGMGVVIDSKSATAPEPGCARGFFWEAPLTRSRLSSRPVFGGLPVSGITRGAPGSWFLRRAVARLHSPAAQLAVAMLQADHAPPVSYGGPVVRSCHDKPPRTTCGSITEHLRRLRSGRRRLLFLPPARSTRSVSAATLGGLIGSAVSARHAGCVPYDFPVRLCAMFAGHCSRKATPTLDRQ